MRSDITPGQTSDYLGFDLVMDDNLPEPAVLLADRECLRLCVSDRIHAVFRYGQASKRPVNIMAS
jgi:hypothetical protein